MIEKFEEVPNIVVNGTSNAELVKFARGTTDKIAGVEPKDDNTFYVDIEANKLYLGDKNLSGEGAVWEELE
jgi:hypothetical protein